MRAFLLPLLSFLALQAACAGCDPPVDDDDGGSGGPCVDADGNEVPLGTTVEAGDGCNTCVCGLSGELSCSNNPCGPVDAGPRPDAGPDARDAGPADAGFDEGPCADVDDDGFHPCIDEDFPDRPTTLDCDDSRFHVQPGGIEFPDTSEDDNCNGTNSDYVTCACGTGLAAADLTAAFDLCDASLTATTRAGDDRQFALLDEYFTAVEPRRRIRNDPDGTSAVINNECLAVLSSGDADDAYTSGFSPSIEFGCAFSDPDPEDPQADDDICDLAQVRMTLQVPPNAQGFAFDFMFLSFEWPEFLCQEFNDTFYAIVENEALNDGDPLNAAFDPGNRPITVNVGFFENPAEWTVPLTGAPQAAAGTGGCSMFGIEEGCELPAYCANLTDSRSGSGSGWLTTRVPVVPGSDLNLVFSIHDEGDGQFDSHVILDSFRWLQDRPPLTTEKAP